MSDLESADLSNASLAGADANHALFDRSNMEHTDLGNTNLYAASLVNTRLAGARFSNTNLSRAGLLKATIDSTALADQNTCGAGMPHTKPADLDPVILKGHSDSVSSLAISPDGKTVAIGTGNGSCLLVKIARKGKKIMGLRQKAILWHLPDGQWAALDTSNHYVCSKQGRAYISFADRLANYPATVVPELERPNGLSII